MQKIARLHSQTAMRIGHPVRNRKHVVDDVPWNRIEIICQSAAIAFCVETCRAAQHRFNDDFKGGAGHCGRRICWNRPLYRAPALNLTLRSLVENRPKWEQRLVSENWGNCASLPAPVGAF